MPNQFESYQMVPITTMDALRHDLLTKPRNRGLTPVSESLAQEVEALSLAGVLELLPKGTTDNYCFKVVHVEDIGTAVEYVRYDDGYETPDDTLV